MFVHTCRMWEDLPPPKVNIEEGVVLEYEQSPPPDSVSQQTQESKFGGALFLFQKGFQKIEKGHFIFIQALPFSGHLALLQTAKVPSHPHS